MANKSFFESNNPVLSEERIKAAATGQSTVSNNTAIIASTMTVAGAVNKTIALFGLMMLTSFASYLMPSMFLLITGAIGGLVAVLFASFKPKTSAISAPVYALFEGLFLGSLSAYYTSMLDGIILQAVILTMGTMLTMLFVYKSGWIKVTEKFRMGVIMATGAVFLLYMFSFIGSFFGFNMPLLHEGGILGIGLSLLIIGIASLNLLLDFDAFEKGEQYAAPKYMEWFCALGLLVTLVWLYVEFLRLLSKLNRD